MKTYISDLKEGQQVGEFFAVRKSDLKTTKAGKTFLALELMDKSGTLLANAWDDAERLAEIARVGEIVKVDGNMTTYDGKLQLKVFDIRSLRQGEDMSVADFRAGTPYEVEALYQELLQEIENLREPLKKLSKNIFASPLAAEYKTASAAKHMHHAYAGGLLEHTVGVMRLCKDFSRRYPKLDRDLLVTGAILHDIGKLKEMQGFLATDYTVEGSLLGHLYMGAEIVETEAQKIANFDESLKLQLKHLILSHHGKLEFGSPVLPKTPEALALSMADELDAHIYQVFKAIADEKDNPGDMTAKIYGLEAAFLKTEGAKEAFPLSMAEKSDGSPAQQPAPKAATPAATFHEDPKSAKEAPKAAPRRGSDQIDLFKF